MGLLTIALTTVFSATTTLAQQVPVTPVDDQTPVEIPVETPVEADSDSLTDAPAQRTFQVPTIVPIPAPAAPTVPLYPPPGPLQEGAVQDEDTYTLGSGDQIVIDIFDVPEFSGDMGTYTLLVDGSVIFPWIGRVSLQGLTLEEAAERLEREYGGRGYIVNPLVTVNLLTARSLRISVVGEVSRPGAYAIAPTGEATTPLQAEGAGGATGGGGGWPTVTQAIQAAGGITQLADLRNVQIRRSLRDGSEELVDVNLWELIRTGQLNEDITLRDGDTLVVPTATDLSPDEAILVGSASFAPGTITVNIVGEVIAPGVVEIPPNTSLNQAIQAAGGFDRQRARTSRVELIRLNPNGTAVRRRISTDLAAGINEESNPALRNGDTVIVGRSGLVSATDTLTTILDPIGTILGTFDIFGIFDGGN
ncbi:MAG: polysaccharide biosynthesis/export family protein [Elainellaceae cyanobacterium]